MKNLKPGKLNTDLLKYTAFFFAFVSLYNFLIVCRCSLWQVDTITYTYHLPDFSFGFVTKVLPGAIYHLFFKEVEPLQLNIYLNCLMLVFFAFVAFALAKLVTSRSSKGSRRTLTVLSIFYLSGPCTFAIFTRELGMLDFYWLLFSVIFLLLVSNKYLKFAVPLIFVLSLLVHFSFVFCYFIFYILILLYRITKAEKKAERISLTVVMVLGIAAVIALALYLIAGEHNNLVYSIDEFHKALDARNKFTKDTYYIYYDYAFYKQYEIPTGSFAEVMKQPLVGGDSFFASLINPIYYQLKIIYLSYLYLPERLLNLIGLLALLAPVCFILFRFWAQKIKVSDNRFQKALYVLMILQFPFTACFGLLFSPDVSRLLTHAFLIQFTLFLYHLYGEDADFAITLQKHRVPKLIALAVYYAVYALTYINPY